MKKIYWNVDDCSMSQWAMDKTIRSFFWMNSRWKPLPKKGKRHFLVCSQVEQWWQKELLANWLSYWRYMDDDYVDGRTNDWLTYKSLPPSIRLEWNFAYHHCKLLWFYIYTTSSEHKNEYGKLAWHAIYPLS